MPSNTSLTVIREPGRLPAVLRPDILRGKGTAVTLPGNSPVLMDGFLICSGRLIHVRGKLFLVLGGTRSGKSEFAEKIAGQLGQRVVYLATAAAEDDEMAERIKLHRKRRPKNWETVEEPREILKVLQKSRAGDVFLLDCLTFWIANLLAENDLKNGRKKLADDRSHIIDRVNDLAGVVEKGVNMVVVSSEVGLGLVPENPLGRKFRDLTGKANQILAKKADKVFFTIAGIPVELKKLASEGGME